MKITSRLAAVHFLRVVLWAGVAALTLRALQGGQPISQSLATPKVTNDSVASLASAVSAAEPLGPSRDRDIVPYTVVVREVAAPGESPATSVKITRGLRSDGAAVLRTEYLPPTSDAVQVSQRLIHLPNRIRVDVDDIRELAFAVRVAEWNPRASERNPGSGCLATYAGVPLGGSVVRNQKVDDLRAVMVTSGTTSRWFALDYGCAEIRMARRDGSGAPEQRVEFVLAGEPDPSLFEVADIYDEADPVSLYRLAPGSRAAENYQAWFREGRLALRNVAAMGRR